MKSKIIIVANPYKLPSGFQLPPDTIQKFTDYSDSLIKWNGHDICNLNKGPENAFRIGVLPHYYQIAENTNISATLTSFTFKWLNRDYNITISVDGGNVKGISTNSMGRLKNQTFQVYDEYRVSFNSSLEYLNVGVKYQVPIARILTFYFY
jgi:hypothetical protein